MGVFALSPQKKDDELVARAQMSSMQVSGGSLLGNQRFDSRSLLVSLLRIRDHGYFPLRTVILPTTDETSFCNCSMARRFRCLKARMGCANLW
jgi:hypothetical protein